MAGPSTNSVLIARLAQAVYGFKLGSATMGELIAISAPNALGNVANLANALYAQDLATIPLATLSHNFVANLGITGAGVAPAEAFVTAVLTNTPVAQRGATLLAITAEFSRLTADPTFGAAARQFNADITNAVAYSQVGGTANVDLHGGLFALDSSVAGVARLTGNSAVRIDITRATDQIVGLDLNRNGVVEINGRENINPTALDDGKNFTIFDAYARNPNDVNDATSNYTGRIRFDGTGFAGNGTSTNGNIFLGGLNADIALGGDGNDFLAGGGSRAFNDLVDGTSSGGQFATGDQLSGGRNADFMFVELSLLSATDGNNNRLDGGSTADDIIAGGAGTRGIGTQDLDWILPEASDDDEPTIIDLDAGGAGGSGFPVAAPASDGVGVTTNVDPLGSIFSRLGAVAGLRGIEAVNASGNLYGFINNVNTVVGARAYDGNNDGTKVGTENYGRGSTSQLQIYGSAANNALIGGYDNDLLEGLTGDDLLMGGDLRYLITNRNNPNLLDSKGGLSLTNNSVGTVNDGKDQLNGGDGNDNIAFESDGGGINGGADTAKTSGQFPIATAAPVRGTDDKPYNGPRFQSQGDTVWLTNFSMGRVGGAVVANEATAQGAALQALTTDATYRLDLGNNGAATFKNYGGANSTSHDQTNYKSVTGSNGTVPRVTTLAMESINTTGLGRIDYKAAGSNTPELAFANQQNYNGIDTNVDLRGSGSDNALIANTGADVLEGRGGDDVISGGSSNDRMLMSFGDAIDWFARPVDANGDNLWDTTGGLVVADGVAWGQDFRPAAAATAGTTTLIVDFGTTILNGVDTFVATFQVNVDGVAYGASIPAATLAAAKTTSEVAAIVNPVFQAINKNVTVVATSATTIEVRALDSTPGDGKLPVIGTTAATGFFVTGQASGAGTYQAKGLIAGLEGSNLEDDRLIIKDYTAAGGFGDRFVNLGADQTKSEINQAAQMVASFGSGGSTLAQADGYTYRLYINGTREGDKISVDINGTKYEYTLKAGETAEDAATGLTTAVNNALDANAASGKINATAFLASDPDFAGVSDTFDTGVNQALVTLTQNFALNSATFMDISATVTRADGSGAFGSVNLHNQANTMAQLLGFNGSNGGLNAQDKFGSPVILFQGRQTSITLPDADPASVSSVTSSLLLTAKNSGQTLRGVDANADADAAINAANYWINGDDLLFGGDGNDTINGGTGDDRVMMSKGTDTVDGGGNLARPLNSDGSSNGTQAFQDVLQAEERTFGTGTSFKVTLDGTVGATGKGVIAAIKADLTPTGDVTNFTGIELVRVLENNRNSELDVKALSDAIAAAAVTGPAGGIINAGGTQERLTIDLNSLAPNTKYNVDLNADGIITANEQFTATAVQGTESVTTGAANDTLIVDFTQLTANNRFTLNGQQDNAVTLVKGQDIVSYDHSGIVAAASRPTLTLAVQGVSTGQLRATGGVLGSQTFTDTLAGVEVTDVTAAATSTANADTIDLTALNGATVNYGAAITVGASLGGKVAPADTVAKVDGNQLDSGAVAANTALSAELMVIAGITKMERVTGSNGDDRVIVNNTMDSDGAAAKLLTFATYLGDANTVNARNVNYYRFDLGAGAGDMVDYRQETGNLAVVVNFGAGADSGLVDSDANDSLADAPNDRVDQLNNVERYFASTGIARIDLSGATGNSTTQFSAESKVTNNEQFDPNGRSSPVVDNQVRGISVSDSTNAVLARFMDADAGESTGAAYWDQVIGSKFAETVNFTNFENAIAETLVLKGGANVVSYNGLTNTSVEIAALIAAGSTTYTVTPQGGAADTITITRGSAGDNGLLTLIATNDSDDSITNAFAAPTKLTGAAVGLIDLTGTVGGGYHLIDLGNGTVVEDVKLNIGGTYSTAGYLNNVTSIQNFENATGGAQQDRIFGNNAANILNGGAGNDILSGGAGADSLTGAGDNDRFNYNAASDGAGFGVTGAGVAGKAADSILDMDAAGDDAIVIDIGLFGALYQDVTTTVDVDPIVINTNGATANTGNVFLVKDAVAANADLEILANVAAKIGTIAGTLVGDGKFFDGGAVNTTVQQLIFIVGAGAGNNAGIYAFRDGDDNNTVSAGELALLSIITNQGVVAAGADAAGEFREADVIMRAGGRTGQQTFDIDNGTTNASTRTELVYTTVSESRIGFVDNVIGFSGATGRDRVDLTALFASKTLAQTAIAAIRQTAAAGNNTGVDVAGFFNDAGVNRAVVVEEFAGGNNTRVFVDVDLDGNFSIANDLVVDFQGTGLGFIANTFVYG